MDSKSAGRPAERRSDAILFDLDGTLTDPREGIVGSLRHAFQAIAQPVPSDDALVKWIGPPLHRAFAEHLGAANAGLVDAAVAAYRERFRDRGLFENVLYPGVSEGLAALAQRGSKLFVATSKPTIYAERILSHFELTQYFEAVHGSELSGERSDKSELVAHLLDQRALSAEYSTMVGDREHDIVGARRNGLRALGVLWGYGSLHELQAAGADEIVATWSELLAALGVA